MEHRSRTDSVATELSEWERRYAGETERPLGSYAGLLATYPSAVLSMIAVARARRVRSRPASRPPTWPF